MKLTTTITLAAALLASNAAAYAQEGAQANASAGTSASVQAGKSGAQASGNAAGPSSTQGGQNSAGLSNGTAVNAALTWPVDAKKNKPGDPVTARTTQSTKSHGHVVIPKGSKLVGHVTEAKARAKGESESALGIVFDKAFLKNGQEVPLNVTVRALAAAPSAAEVSSGQEELAAGAAGGTTARASGSALGGVRSTAGAATSTVTNTAASAGSVASGTAGGALNSTANVAGSSKGAVGGLNSAGQLTSNSQGVFGLNGLNLNSAASSTTQGSLITSTSKNVHLDSGTQLLLVAQGQASAAASQH